MYAVARIAFLIFVVVLAGCSTTQEVLEPRVCDYEAERAEVRDDCERQTLEIVGAIASHEIDRAFDHAVSDGEETARELQRMAQREDDEADDLYRDPEELAEEPINPVVADSPVEFESEEAREDFEEAHDLELTDDVEVFRGRFKPGEPRTTAVHRPGQSLRLYDPRGQSVSSVDLSSYEQRLPPADEISDFPTGAVELVQDGSDQLKLLHAESDDQGRITYHLSVYKFIGSRIGTIFSQPIAVREAADEPVHTLARVRYLHGLDHRIIEWTPIDEEGEQTEEPTHYEWNRWEGVYRVPKPPPTAPTSSLGPLAPR